MSKFNLLVMINSYADAQSSNQPSRSFMKWTRDISGLDINDNSESRGYTLAANETKTLLDNTVSLGGDNTTQWDWIAGNKLSSTVGTAPDLSSVAIGYSVIVAGVTYLITSVDNTAKTIGVSFPTAITPATNVGQILVYSEALSLIYMESNAEATVLINGTDSATIEPFVSTSSVVTPGMLLNKRTVYKLSITNESAAAATVYFAGVE